MSLGMSLLSAAVSDLTESPVFMRNSRGANRPKVVAKLVATGDPSSAALMDSVSLTLKTAEKRRLPAIMTPYLRWSAVLGRVPRSIDLIS